MTYCKASLTSLLPPCSTTRCLEEEENYSTSGSDIAYDTSDSLVMKKFLELVPAFELLRVPRYKILTDLFNLSVFPKCVVFDLDDTIWKGDVDCTNGPPFYSMSSIELERYGRLASSFQKKRHYQHVDAGSTSVITSPTHSIDLLFDTKIPVSKSGGDYKLNKKKSDLNQKSFPVRPALTLFEDVLSIFCWLQSKRSDIQIAIASRTTEPNWATQALKHFALPNGTTFWELISASQCVPCNKQHHIHSICRTLSITPADIVFYDNLYFNLTDVAALPILPEKKMKQTKQKSPVVVYTPDGLDWVKFVEGLVEFQTSRS